MTNASETAASNTRPPLPRELNLAELQQAGGARLIETEKDPVFVIIGGSAGR